LRRWRWGAFAASALEPAPAVFSGYTAHVTLQEIANPAGFVGMFGSAFAQQKPDLIGQQGLLITLGTGFPFLYP